MWCTFHLQEKYLLGTHNKTPYSFLLKNLSSHNAVGHQVIKPSQHHDNTNMQRSGFKPSAKLGLGKSIEKCKLCKNCKFYTIGYQAKIFFQQNNVFLLTLLMPLIGLPSLLVGKRTLGSWRENFIFLCMTI